MLMHIINAQQTNCYTDEIISNQDWFPQWHLNEYQLKENQTFTMVNNGN